MDDCMGLEALGREGEATVIKERKKSVPWTEEEHRLFLMGLKKHGKGDWRNISRNYVISRTPTQVARHAQKYFHLMQLSAESSKDVKKSLNLAETDHHLEEKSVDTVMAAADTGLVQLWWLLFCALGTSFMAYSSIRDHE